MAPIIAPERMWLDPVALVETLLPRRIVEAASTLFGLWTAVSPLLLWIAWPPGIWMAILWSTMISLVLTGIFTAALMPRAGPPDSRGPVREPGAPDAQPVQGPDGQHRASRNRA